MLTAEQINSIHRLHWAEHCSVRKIARHLHLGRRTISQYLATPARRAARRQRASKLDPFKSTIEGGCIDRKFTKLHNITR
jgi:transposase